MYLFHQKTDLVTEVVKVYLKIIISEFHARENPSNKAAISGNIKLGSSMIYQ